LILVSTGGTSAFAAPGDQRWELELPAAVNGAPALAPNGDVVVGLSDGSVRAITPQGPDRWTFQAAAYATCSPTIGLDGTIYFGGDTLYALNPEGTVRWSLPWPDSASSGYIRYLGAPVLGPDGAVYVAGIPYPTEERRLFCVNPDGTLRWKLAKPFREGPVLGIDGTLYIEQEYGGLLAINPDGIARWESENSFVYRPAQPAALTASGSVLVPLAGNTILLGGIQSYALDGTPGWIFETDGEAVSSPVVAPDGTIYGGFISGRVIALEGNGQKRWEYQVDGLAGSYESVSVPAVAADGTLYFAAGQWLHALNPAGQLLWRFDGGTNRLDSPLIGADGTVYFGGHNDAGARLYAVQGSGSALADAGWPMFRRDVRHPASLATAPIVPAAPTNLTATVSNYTDKVTISWDSVPQATHYEVWRNTTQDLNGAGAVASDVTGTVHYEDRSATPEVTYYYFVRARNVAGPGPWTGPVAGLRRVAAVGEAVWILPTGGALVGTPAIAGDGTVYVCSSDGKLYAADTNGLSRWTFTFGGATAGTPSIGADGTIYFSAAISRYPAPETNALFAVEPNGQLKWKRVGDAPFISGVAVGATDAVYVALADYYGGDADRVMATDLSGNVLWTFANGRTFTVTPVVGADGTVYVSAREGWLHALDASGRLLWECFTDDSYLGSPVIAAGGVLLFAGANFHAVNTDGEHLWMVPTEGGVDSGASCVDAAGLLYAQADYTYYTIDPATRAVRKFALPNSLDRLQQHVLRDGDGTLYLAAWNGVFADMLTGKVYAVAPAGEVQWEYSLYQVRFGTPALGQNAALYVPGSDGRLYAFRTASGLGVSSWPHVLHDPQHTARSTEPLPVPPAPATVSATQRSRVIDVRVSWGSARSATGYEIYRATGTNLAGAVFVGSTTGPRLFDDRSTIPEVSYTYWVRATNLSGASAFSPPATGMRRQAVPGDLLYEWDLHGEIDTAPAIADDGTLYVSVNLPVFNAPDAARKLVALGPGGTVKWQYLTGQALLTSPTVGPDGTIYVAIRGSLIQSPYPSPLLAVNPNGTPRWEFMADNALETTPVLGADGSIFVASFGGTIYRVTPDGALVWSLNVSNSVSALAAGRDGTLYATLDGGRLVAVRPDGRLLWDTGAGLANARGFALGENGDLYLACGYRGVRSFHPDGVLAWESASGQPYSAPPIVGSNGVVIIGNNSGLWCFSPAGTNQWSTSTGGSHGGAAALSADGFIYAVNYAGRLVALGSDGSLAWDLLLGSASSSSPAIAPDGTIYVGCQDGKLRSIYGAGPPADTAWPMFQHDVRHSGRDPRPAELPGIPGAVAASDGTFNDRVAVSWLSAAGAGFYEVWRNTEDDVGTAVMLAEAVGGRSDFEDRTAVAGTNYLYWVRSGNGVGLGPFSEAEAGYRRIALPGEPIASFSPNGPAGNSPTASRDGSVRFGSDNARFYALEPDLTQRWEFPISSGPWGYFSTGAVGLDGTAYFWGSNGRFYALAPDGLERWSFLGPYQTSLPPALAPDGTIIVAGRDQTVSGLGPAGGLLWQYRAASGITSPPSVGTDGAVFFGTEDGQLYALNPDGSLRWRYRTGATIESSPAVGTDGVVYFGSDDRGIYAVGPDGRRRWAAQAADRVVAQPVIAPDGSVVVGSWDRRLYAFGPDGSKRWEFVADSAVYGSACVGTDGAIYFGTRNGWVYGLNPDGAQVWTFNSATNAVSGMILQSPLLLENRLLVPLDGAALLALAVPGTMPAEVNWPQFRHDPQRTAHAQGWLGISATPPVSGWLTGDRLTVSGALGLTNRAVVRLELRVGTEVVAVATNGTSSLTWSSATAGTHLLTLRAWDDTGTLHFSPTLTVRVAGPPTLAIAPDGAGGWRLSFDTLIGRGYQVESSANLTTWIPMGDPQTASGASQVWAESDPPSGAAYYRVKVLP
jgi:outer membrane protein assembly factor BamB